MGGEDDDGEWGAIHGGCVAEGRDDSFAGE